jgi:catechol 2,3-dioxygenase-like lactoylglutathione lyase family enzyme
MISAVDKININVRDQDAARRCWIETMGFSLVTDEPIGEEPGGARWIEGRPPHSAVTLVLYSLTFDASRLGSLSPVLFTCDDIQKTHQELTARGVEFPDPPSRRSWGWWATFTDNEGNLYGPGQRSTD